MGMEDAYPSLRQYAEDYCGYTFDSKTNTYGYYCNPNAFWDWYSIGGRWPFQFLVRDTAERINGERSWGNEDAVCEAPEGYISMDLLSIDMYESEVHYYLIKAMLMSGSKTLSQIYFRQAEPYLTDEHMQEVKTLFTSCRT